MKLPLISQLMCCVLLLTIVNSNTMQAQSVGQEAPVLVLPDQSGQNSALSDLKGNYVYLHFWASWCKNSVEQLPTIAQIHEHYKTQNFKMYSVSLDASRDAWLNAVKVYQLNWPQHHCDFNGPFSNNLKDYKSVVGTPFGFLIDPNGTILERDPSVYDYQDWFIFDPNAVGGSYYTVNLGDFNTFEYVDFDYIEANTATIESGVNDDGSYYIHLGKFQSRTEAEQTLLKALGIGYYDATIVSESLGGQSIGLTHIQPSTRALKAAEKQSFDYTIPENTPQGSTTPNAWSSVPTAPSNPSSTYSMEGSRSTQAPTFKGNNNYSTAPLEGMISQNTYKAPQQQTPPQQFYTPPSNTPNPEVNAYNLPEPQQYPNPQLKSDQDVYANPTLHTEPKNKGNLDTERDFFNNPNPFINNNSYNGQEPNPEYNFENKWRTPQTKPEQIFDENTQKELDRFDGNSQESPYDNRNYNFDPNASFDSSYSNDDPLSGIYLEEEENLPAPALKESKYERKLRMKKKKMKKKQAKLKRQMDKMKEDIEEIDNSIQFSSQYRD